MSRAVTHLPCLVLHSYYTGPSFLGPAHPLVPSDNEEVPEVFYAYLFYLQEGEETFSVKQIEQARKCLVMQTLPTSSRDVGVVPDDADSDGWDIVAEEYVAAARIVYQACNHLKTALLLTRTDVDKEICRRNCLSRNSCIGHFLAVSTQFAFFMLGSSGMTKGS